MPGSLELNKPGPGRCVSGAQVSRQLQMSASVPNDQGQRGQIQSRRQPHAHIRSSEYQCVSSSITRLRHLLLLHSIFTFPISFSPSPFCFPLLHSIFPFAIPFLYAFNKYRSYFEHCQLFPNFLNMLNYKTIALLVVSRDQLLVHGELLHQQRCFLQFWPIELTSGSRPCSEILLP